MAELFDDKDCLPPVPFCTVLPVYPALIYTVCLAAFLGIFTAGYWKGLHDERQKYGLRPRTEVQGPVSAEVQQRKAVSDVSSDLYPNAEKAEQ